MGYAVTGQTGLGVHTRLFARAFALADDAFDAERAADMEREKALGLPTATDAGAPLPADTAQTAAPDGMPA